MKINFIMVGIGLVSFLVSVWGGFYCCYHCDLWEMSWMFHPTWITAVGGGLMGSLMIAIGLGI